MSRFYNPIYNKGYENGFTDGANQQTKISQEIIINSIGCIEGLLEIIGDSVLIDDERLTEEEQILEDCKNLLEQLYELKED